MYCITLGSKPWNQWSSSSLGSNPMPMEYEICHGKFVIYKTKNWSLTQVINLLGVKINVSTLNKINM